MPAQGSEADGVVVLGAGYAGLRFAHELQRRRRERFPIQLLDRHPFSVLRTELYKIADLARHTNDRRAWLVPIARSIGRGAIQFRVGEVTGIDLDSRTVRLAEGSVSYDQLAICVGSDIAYYGVPGAREYTYQVYHFSRAVQLAEAMRELEARSAGWAGDRHPRIAVVGGGSTGTEVATDIATANWRAITRSSAKRPQVTLVCGELPFLAGFSDGLVGHAREILGEAGVTLSEGVNVVRVAPGELELKNGERHPFDLCVWAAGIQAPAFVREIAVPHGHGGRISVEPTLEVRGRPGVFAIGDVAELTDPASGIVVPAMAQAALAEAPIAAANLLARRSGRPLRPFVYREKGSIVALGAGRGAGVVRHLTIWGRPAGLLKEAVDREVAAGQRRGIPPPGL